MPLKIIYLARAQQRLDRLCDAIQRKSRPATPAGARLRQHRWGPAAELEEQVELD